MTSLGQAISGVLVSFIAAMMEELSIIIRQSRILYNSLGAVTRYLLIYVNKDNVILYSLFA